MDFEGSPNVRLKTIIKNNSFLFQNQLVSFSKSNDNIANNWISNFEGSSNNIELKTSSKKNHNFYLKMGPW